MGIVSETINSRWAGWV